MSVTIHTKSKWMTSSASRRVWSAAEAGYHLPTLMMHAMFNASRGVSSAAEADQTSIVISQSTGLRERPYFWTDFKIQKSVRNFRTTPTHPSVLTNDCIKSGTSKMLEKLLDTVPGLPNCRIAYYTSNRSHSTIYYTWKKIFPSPPIQF